MNIIQFDFPKTQFNEEETAKRQIYLHHTAGNSNPFGVFRDWSTNRERIATCVTIGGKPRRGDREFKDGDIVQGFSSRFWAFHLGLRESTFRAMRIPYMSLDSISIGIEICNWGQLTQKGKKFYNYVNGVVPNDEVIELSTPHRGFKFYHNYTDAQIESTRRLLLLWKERFNIPLTYNNDIWDVTPRALRGESGVFTHNSVRFDKVDVYPHPKLIQMLKSL
jgi:hypothetical protein